MINSYIQVKSNGQTGDSHSSSSSINSLMSDAARSSINEWNDSSSLIVDQSKVSIFQYTVHILMTNSNLLRHFQLHASLTHSRSPLNEKQTPNFNCDGSHNSNINNNTSTKLNSGTTIDSSLQQQALGASNNIDISQKHGFTGML